MLSLFIISVILMLSISLIMARKYSRECNAHRKTKHIVAIMKFDNEELRKENHELRVEVANLVLKGMGIKAPWSKAAQTRKGEGSF